MQTLKLVCGPGRGVRQLENTNFWKSFQYFDTKFGQCLYLDIFYLLSSLFCSLKSYFPNFGAPTYDFRAIKPAVNTH